MKQLKFAGWTAKIWLSNGVYLFPPESAEGKTFLYQIISGNRGIDKECVAFTYDDYIKGVNICSNIRSGEFSYILLDRLDMYQTDDIVRLVSELSCKATIMIDVKNRLGNYTGIFSGCWIRMSLGCLEVFPT